MYSAMDVNEALQCWTELTTQYPGRALAQSVTYSALSKAVEQSSPAQRELAGRFLAELMRREDPQGKVERKEVMGGVRQWLEMLSDVAIDIPHAPTHTQTILSSLLAKKLLPFEQIMLAHANAVDQEVMVESDAATWLVALLKQLRAQLASETPDGDVDAALLSILQPSPSCSSSSSSSAAESSIKFARFFGGEATRGAAALNDAGLEKLAAVLC